jgi:hypothetical protein
MQNLSVLTRGNTLKAAVSCSGGPNTYLPFLQDCWRLASRSLARARLRLSEGRPIEELVFVPENAQYYAALGAVLYGLHETAHVGWLKGSRSSSNTSHGRKARLGESAGPPLSKDEQELEDFR